MRLVSYVEVKRFEFDYICSGDVSKSVNKQQIGVFDIKSIKKLGIKPLFTCSGGPVYKPTHGIIKFLTVTKLVCFLKFFFNEWPISIANMRY